MPAPALQAPDFGAFGPNPTADVLEGIATAVAQAPYQEAQLQSVGQQVLANALAPAVTNRALRSDPAFIARIQRIARMYHLPVPMLGTQGGTWDAAQGQGAPQTSGAGTTTAGAPTAVPPSAQAGPASPPAAPPLNFGVPPGEAPGQAQTFPLGSMIQQEQQPTPGVGPGAGAAMAYQQMLTQVGQNPSLLRDPRFEQQITQAAQAAGRAPQLPLDIKAAVQKAKASGTHGPSVAAQAAQTAQNAAQGQGPPQSPGGAPGGLAATQTATTTNAGTPPGDPSAQPSSMTGPDAAYMAPNEGPRRLDVNAMLGRTLSFTDFKALSGMMPQDRVEALRQGGYDLEDFDPKWLNSNPSLDPAQQITLAHDAAIALTDDIKNGATPDQIKLSVSTYRPYLTPAQNAELDANITDSLDANFRIRRQQVESNGLLRRDTLNFMEHKFNVQQQNVGWEHNYKYTVLNDKNAQWSADHQLRYQNAQTSAARVNEEIRRDQAQGYIDANGKVLKGGGQVKPGELISAANKLLTSINTDVNEYNTRLQNALQNPGKAGVNQPMEQDIQDEIDSYNLLVDQMDSRGMHYFTHYRGPDQGTLRANTAQAMAGSAVNAQGQQTQTPPPARTQMPAGAQPGTFPNNQHGYELKGRYYLDNGTRVDKNGNPI